MNRRSVLLGISTLTLMSSVAWPATTITGAGSTFIYPVMARWAADYEKSTGTKINYQSIGSGGGVKQIQNKTVNFGATDYPLTEAELDKANLVQWPQVRGDIVPVINVPELKGATLIVSINILADIFSGKITRWKQIHPNLPEKDILVVRRADGSGTTFNFTKYLSEISPEWKEKYGFGPVVDWPVGISAKGNEGVTANVSAFPYSIGYVEWAYAKQNNLQVLNLTEASGVSSGIVSEALMPNAFRPGEKNWPINATTYILIPKGADKNILKFFEFAFQSEQTEKLDYVRIEPELIEKIKREVWSKI